MGSRLFFVVDVSAELQKMELSRSQINCMQLDAEVEHAGIRLPSLKRKCGELGLKQDGTSVNLRKRLRRFKREAQALEMLQCPICTCTPPQDELLVICSSGHHLCFRCLLGMLQHGCCTEVCPLCREDLQLRPQGYLLQQLLPTSMQHDFARSAPFHLYRQLQRCQFFRGPTTLEHCRGMAQLWYTPANRRAAERLIGTWDAYTAAMSTVEALIAANSESEESEESDSE